MSSSSAAFSYAQAAKGLSTPTVVPNDDSSTTTQIHDDAPEQELNSAEKDPRLTSANDMKQDLVQASTGTNPSRSQVEESTSGLEPKKGPDAKDQQSEVISPNASSDVAAKVSNEDNVPAAPAQCEPTWEKTSEKSASEQVSEKSDTNQEGKNLSTYEQTKPQMKEAPLPAVSVWHKPWENAQARVGSKAMPNVNKTEDMSPSVTYDSVDGLTNSRDSIFGARSVASRSKAEGLAKKPTSATTSTGNVVLDADAGSWPTPDSAIVEDKKTSSEKPEQSEKSSIKPHGKHAWEKINFTPSAVFKTPVPVRGGPRGGRTGGRGGREITARGGVASSSSFSGEHINGPVEADTSNPAGNPAERFKSRDTGNMRGGLTTKPKRSSDSAAAITRDSVADGSSEKRESIGQRTGNHTRSNDTRHPPNSAQGENVNLSGHFSTLDTPKRQSLSSEASGEARFSRTYQSRSRESGSEPNIHMPSRDRSDGRSERGGRGGWRGRSNGQMHNNSVGSSHYQQSLVNGRSYSDQRQNSYPTSFSNSREARHSRTNSRSQSIPNGQSYARFNTTNLGINGLPALQTDIANALPIVQQPAIMSAMPFQQFMDPVQALPGMVQMQLEYYFSVDNLCKDIFLRSHMDSQGFAPLPFIATFHRIKTLTTDMNILKLACANSRHLELVTTHPSHEGYYLVRKSEDWKPWVLPYAQREAAAKNEGPTQVFAPKFEGYPPVLNNFEAYASMSHSVPMSPANSFQVNGYRGETFPTEGNFYRGPVHQHSLIQTPLSADVPDFQPARTNGYGEMKFYTPSEPEQKFSNYDVDQLRIYVEPGTGKNIGTEAVSTVSVINGTSNLEADENAPPKLNGDGAQEHTVNGAAKDPEDMSKLSNGNSSAPPSTTATGENKITWSTSPNQMKNGEMYHSLRSRARQDILSMNVLYEFWMAFLPDNFNTQLYQDFHGTALEEANVKRSLIGLKHLAAFYSTCLRSDSILPDRLLKDFADLAMVELSNENHPKERPALTQLRKLWTNGEISTANRMNLDQKLDDSLKAALGHNDLHS